MRYQEFDDFDAFATSIRDVDSNMMLVNPQRHFWTSAAVDLDGIDLQFGQLGSGNLAQVELRPDGYMFYLPLTRDIGYSANGIVLSTKSFAVVDPGSEFCISTKVAHDWCAAFIPTERLDQHLVDLPSSLKSSTCRVTRPNRHAAHRFQTIVLQTMDAAANCCDFESTAAARVAAQEILKVALFALDQRETVKNDHRTGGRPKIAREQIIKRCRGFLEQSAGDSVSVSDLAAAASVSEGTLRTAFKDYYGMGPNRYLITRQLHRVHRALSRADPDETSVGKILFDHGIWELGRFATRHRQLFGELPSETLRRRSG